MRTLRVYLKFKTENSKKIGFVTKDGKSWLGCYEHDNRPKKVVLADAGIMSKIEDGVLYKSILIPMKRGTGFVAITATPVKFEASVSTVIVGDKFKVIVIFGNKSVEYDPYSVDKKKNSLSEITMYLNGRTDLKDKERVLSDFNSAAMSAARQFGLKI